MRNSRASRRSIAGNAKRIRSHSGARRGHSAISSSRVMPMVGNTRFRKATRRLYGLSAPTADQARASRLRALVEPFATARRPLPRPRGSGLRAVAKGSTSALSRLALAWSAVGADNPYSRRVAFLKRVLPTIGITLLLLIALWPRLAPLWERMRFAFPAIDLREARELRMLNPRYAGN